jgi:hypothetical protein
MMAKMMSLAVTPWGSAVHGDLHVLGLLLDQRLRGEHMLDLAGADAMGERTKGAMGGGVAVAADDGRARQREALLGADDVDDALARSRSLKYSTPKARAFSASVSICVRDSSPRCPASGRGRHVMVDHGQSLVRRAHLAAGQAQALEGLGACHLMHKVPVDIEQAGAVRLLVDDVVVPDLVIKRARMGHIATGAEENHAPLT